jgi:hypothetical protein
MRPTPPPATRRKGSFGGTLRAVAWSFFGVRKRAQYEADAEQLNPLHLIVIGILAAALFIGVLLAIIKFVVLR